MPSSGEPIFIFGATGFVGRNLLVGLAGRGYQVTCLVRDSRGAELVSRLGTRPIVGELLQPETYRPAIQPGSTVIYLVRMGDPRRYGRDQTGARIVMPTCRDAGVSRVVHLTGLLDPRERLSPYFASRLAVARVVQESGLPTAILRASLIFGQGSVSYELLKAALLRLPVIPLPPWRGTRVQPIVIADVIRCLHATIERAGLTGVFDIGGPEVYTYGELLKKFAEVRGLRRKFFNLPFEARPLAALLLSRLSGIGVGETRALLESLQNASVVSGENAIETVFGFRPAPVFPLH